MADKKEIKSCLDELGNLLQQIATLEEEEEYKVHVFTNEGLVFKKQFYKEMVQDLADIASVQVLDQLYKLLEIEV